MVRHLATIRTITDITPIDKADRIETAHIDGWPVVVGKNEFKVGDPVVFFEIDSMLPLDNPVFAPLEGRGKTKINSKDQSCLVLRTVKLRKQLSQGLVMSLESLGIDPGTPLGTDVSEQLGIEKYEAPEMDAKTPHDDYMKEFPDFLDKTDEPRVQNLSDMVEYLAAHPEVRSNYRATEKLDGTSVTFYKYTGPDPHAKYQGIFARLAAAFFRRKYPDRIGRPFGVCSRNKDLTYTNESKDTLYWKLFKAFGMRQILNDLAEDHKATTVAVQGEITGPKVSGNRLDLSTNTFSAFNVLIDGKRYDPAQFPDLMNICVPQLELELPDTMDAILAQADGLKSVLAPSRLAEGIVWRNDIDDLPDDEWSHFKAINNTYLAKLKEA